MPRALSVSLDFSALLASLVVSRALRVARARTRGRPAREDSMEFGTAWVNLEVSLIIAARHSRTAEQAGRAFRCWGSQGIGASEFCDEPSWPKTLDQHHRGRLRWGGRGP